ncbi:MAG TPA: hypothetical protein VNX15_00745 [Gemmatimonadales bacterium]|nr:hypothetical protein [Gemmatimonadales bacterium]
MIAVTLLLAAALQHSGPLLDVPAPTDSPAFAAAATPPAPTSLFPVADTGGRTRPRAIEYSDFYGVRLEIHRAASYATLPLFVGEFALGQTLYNHPPGSSATLTAHRLTALGLAGLFGVNTVTGAWNLWESRHDPADKTRRYIHAALMFISDAGFVASGASAPSPRRVTLDPGRATTHRTIALASMGVALVGYGMMLIWKK